MQFLLPLFSLIGFIFAFLAIGAQCPSSHMFLTPHYLQGFLVVCAFGHDKNPSRGKLDPKSLRCVFIGYSPTQKGYKCFHSPSNNVYISRDVTFWESESFYSTPSSPQGENTSTEELMDLEDTSIMYPIVINVFSQGEPHPISHPVSSQQEESHDRWNKLNLKTYSRREKELVLLVLPHQSHAPYPSSQASDGNISIENISIESLDLPIALRKVPQRWEETIQDEKWKQAMIEEMNALKKNETWDLVPLLNGKKPVRCK